MKLTRILVGLSIVASIAVAVLNFVYVAKKVETTENLRASEQKAKVEAQGERDTAKRELKKTQTELADTKATLEATTAERDKAVASEAVATKRAAELTEKLAKTQTDLEAAKADVNAYAASGYSPQQVATLAKEMKETQIALEASIEEKKILSRKLAKAENKLAELLDAEYTGPVLPASLKGSVMVVDPKWDFVIINVGEDQGLLENGQLLVSRDGKLVGKLRVRTVEKGRSVANILPGWKVGEVMEGDLVIPAS